MATNTPTRPQVSGILNCFKPPRVTSRVIVDAVQREVRPSKVGHAGTLDPLAEGVLVVAVGSASRLIPYLHLFPKTYRARFELGCWSDSADLETEVIAAEDLPVPSLNELTAAAKKLTGKIQQVPPLYSAVKVGGKRAYDAARNNQLLDLSARTVQVHRFEILKYEFPSVWVEIECGTGTYIRSLAVDLAKMVGTRGLMSHLVRSSVGPFCLEEAVRVDAGLPAEFESQLHPLSSGVAMLPQVTLSETELVEVEHGRLVHPASDYQVDPGEPIADIEIAAMDAAGCLRAILVPRNGGLGPKRVFKRVET